MRDFLSAGRELKDLLNSKQLHDETWTPSCEACENQENSIKGIQRVKIFLSTNLLSLKLSETHRYVKERSRMRR